VKPWLPYNKVSTIVVHTFKLGDVEDPDLYAAIPLGKWQDSESGKWVMEHAVETPWWERPRISSYIQNMCQTYRSRSSFL
jgi:hypothetical protein